MSKGQLDRQADHLKAAHSVGLHILLGTTAHQYYRDDQYDDIAKLTENSSSKVEYKELIQLLDEFKAKGDSDKVTVKMAHSYRAALSDQIHSSFAIDSAVCLLIFSDKIVAENNFYYISDIKI